MNTDKLNVKQEFTKLAVGATLCLVIVVGCHLFFPPRISGPEGGGEASFLRHKFTIAYFGAIMGFLGVFIAKRGRLSEIILSHVYADCPRHFERIWKRYKYSLDRASGVVFGLMLAFVSINALLVLGHWHEVLATMAGPLKLGWWVTLLALLGIPIFGKNLFKELYGGRLQLDRELKTGNYSRRPISDLFKNKRQSTSRAVETTKEPSVFLAGGEKWHLSRLNQNCVVFGQSGSGKTICILNTMIEGILAASNEEPKPIAALVLDPKGDFEGKLKRLCEKYKRGGDFLMIDPKRPELSARWNPFDSDDDALELAGRFASVLETIGMKSDKDTFWIDNAKKFIQHAITLIRLTNKASKPPSFEEIYALATSAKTLGDRVDRLDVTIDDHSLDLSLQFFADDWTCMPENTRNTIVSTLTNMINPFLMEPYRTLFAGRSTARLGDLLDAGKILYVNMPVADRPTMAKTIGTLVKLEYFREVLKRIDKPRRSLFMCDEFQVFFTKDDADFLERNRQSNHINLLATQNIPALKKVTDREETVENLLGNCMVKIFLRNTDDKTNRYAANLFGQEYGATLSGDAPGALMTAGDRGGHGGSAADQLVFVVPPEDFVRLTIPSKVENIPYGEAYIHDGSRSNMNARPQKSIWKVHPIK